MKTLTTIITALACTAALSASAQNESNPAITQAINSAPTGSDAGNAPVAANTEKPETNTRPNAEESMRAFLDQEGFRYNVDANGILFKYNGRSYVFWRTNSSDLVQISYIFGEVNESNMQKALFICNEFNNKKGVLKFSVVNQSIYCNFEFFSDFGISNDSILKVLEHMERNAAELSEAMTSK